ncbi:MAG: DUF3253 domain-containing protein [Pseudomonadota bacterium]
MASSDRFDELRADIRSEIIRRVLERGAGKTICPSEVARALSPVEAEWRSMMPAVREEAAKLQIEGEIEVTQKGLAVSVPEAKGPIRLGLPKAMI